MRRLFAHLAGSWKHVEEAPLEFEVNVVMLEAASLHRAARACASPRSAPASTQPSLLASGMSIVVGIAQISVARGVIDSNNSLAFRISRGLMYN